MKRCLHCKQEKEISLFVKDSRNKDGYSNVCLECNRIACKNRYHSKTPKVLASIAKNIEKTKEYYNKNPWVKMFKSIHDRTSYKNHHYFKKGVKNFLTVEDVRYLFERDGGHLLKKASVDRIDNNKHYSLDNCRVIELSENKRRKSWVQ